MLQWTQEGRNLFKIPKDAPVDIILNEIRQSQKDNYWMIPLACSFSCSVVSNSLWSHGLQHARPPCPSPNHGACPNSCPLSQWCYPTISPSVVPFSSCLQSFPASRSFPMIQFFTSGGQSNGVSASASVFPVNIQDQFLLGLTGLISLQSKGDPRIFSNTIAQMIIY